MTEISLLIILTVGIVIWLDFWLSDFSDIKSYASNYLPLPSFISGELNLSGYQTIALFGVDNRSVGDYETGNSDCIMICAINNDTKEVRLASVYRDTFLDTGDEDLHKANYAYNHGGVKDALDMLHRNLDIDIDEYVTVDFVALVNAIDALGGIDLDEGLSESEVYDLTSWHDYIGEVAALSGKAANAVTVGQTHLDGVQACAYCRIRYVDSDFIRAGRQRTVLSKLVEKAKAANIAELSDLIKAVFPEVSTSLSLTDILALAATYHSYNLTEMTGFPFDKRGATYGAKGDVVVPCTLESNAVRLHQFLYDDENYAPSNTLRHISEEIAEYSGFTEESAVDYGRYDITE